MLGMIEGGRRRGQQRMRWLEGITDTMDMSLGPDEAQVVVGPLRDPRHHVGRCSVPVGPFRVGGSLSRAVFSLQDMKLASLLHLRRCVRPGASTLAFLKCCKIYLLMAASSLQMGSLWLWLHSFG